MKTFVSVADAKVLVAEGLPAPRLARLSLARAAGHVVISPDRRSSTRKPAIVSDTSWP